MSYRLTTAQYLGWVKGIEPVSYTHLDVYKRQNQYRVIAPINGNLPDLLGAVKAVYGRSNFVGRVVEAAGPGAGGGYSGIPGREKRL